MTASPFQPATEKVWIGSIDQAGNEAGNKSLSLSVVAQYNPGTLEVKQSVPWKKPDAASQGTGANAAPKADKNYMVMEFTGAEGREISLELLFDDFESDTGTIVDKIGRLEELARVRKPGSNADADRRPHHCVVVWANVLPRFQCVITALSTKYTMFKSDGTPLRATVTITLKEALRVDRKKA